MKYNFDEVIDRSHNRSSKYDERVKKFGTADVIPLWVADMDFRTAQPIIDACKAKAEEGIWGYTSRPASYFEAVQEWEVKRNGWKPDTALMSWSLGVVPAMSAIVKLFRPGRGQGPDPDAGVFGVLRRDRGLGPHRGGKQAGGGERPLAHRL